MKNVNLNEHRIKETGSSYTVNKNAFTVEKMELVGLDYLWRVVLEVPSEEIAMLAVEKLMELSYTWLSPKLKKVTFQSYMHVNWNLLHFQEGATYVYYIVKVK